MRSTSTKVCEMRAGKSPSNADRIYFPRLIGEQYLPRGAAGGRIAAANRGQVLDRIVTQNIIYGDGRAIVEDCRGYGLVRYSGRIPRMGLSALPKVQAAERNTGKLQDADPHYTSPRRYFV